MNKSNSNGINLFNYSTTLEEIPKSTDNIHTTNTPTVLKEFAREIIRCWKLGMGDTPQCSFDLLVTITVLSASLVIVEVPSKAQ